MRLSGFFSAKTIYYTGLTVFLFYFLYRVLLLFYPHPDSGGVEGNVVYFIQRILDHQPLYPDPEQAPFAIAQYGPLYYYLVAAIGRITGTGAAEVQDIFLTGRFVSLVLNVVMMLVVFRICRNVFSVSIRAAITAAVTSFIFLTITSFARPDSLYHVFSLGSIGFLLKAEKTGYKKGILLLSAFLAVMALFTKQTGVVLPLITGSWLIWNKKYRQLFLYSFIYLVATGAALMIIDQAESLTAWYRNTIQGVNNGISPGWYLVNFLKQLFYGPGIVLIPAFFLIIVLVRNERRNVHQLSGYILIMLFLMLNLIGLKLGSVPGYLTEWWVMLFVLLAVYWPIITKAFTVVQKQLPAAVALTVLLIKMTGVLAQLQEKWQAARSPQRLAAFRKEEEVAQRVLALLNKDESYTVFTNLYTPESYLSNLLFRHALVPQLEIVSLSTYPQKRYDYSALRNGLQQGTIRLMLVKDKANATRFFDISLDKYVLIDSVNNVYLYQYKP